ncbi:hypothetical protein O7621_10185 [Solwaraspora sp. WMMD937]|uniref:hypothetical protein n=1 Tax=Solwaraspora sp. WMMD937 TaxID=3016090 RepID=UPI00249B1BFC|nr:hypothetical protein [Solwaraspora sp. WMMD937]WFE23599.1 hypothetical protein O7621_10185 [Solwaraspora sp. WMMD937]
MLAPVLPPGLEVALPLPPPALVRPRPPLLVEALGLVLAWACFWTGLPVFFDALTALSDLLRPLDILITRPRVPAVVRLLRRHLWPLITDFVPATRLRIRLQLPLVVPRHIQTSRVRQRHRTVTRIRVAVHLLRIGHIHDRIHRHELAYVSSLPEKVTDAIAVGLATTGRRRQTQ